jgi:hypothetical protein
LMTATTFRCYPSKIPTYAFGKRDVGSTGRIQKRSSTTAVGAKSALSANHTASRKAGFARAERERRASQFFLKINNCSTECRIRHEFNLWTRSFRPAVEYVISTMNIGM